MESIYAYDGLEISITWKTSGTSDAWLVATVITDHYRRTDRLTADETAHVVKEATKRNAAIPFNEYARVYHGMIR